VGPNGAGKSSLLKALAGLLPCTGANRLLGRDWHDWPARARAQQLAWLGQGQLADDELTVHDLVLLGRLPHRAWLAPASEADYAAVQQALQTVELWELRARSVGHLSGGQRQRVLLARALATQARVLLLDEPLADLDPPHQARCLDQLRAQAASGVAVLTVLHELSMALCADYLLVLNQGRVQHHGPCDHPATHRALEQVFGPRVQVHEVEGRWVALVR